MENSLSTSDDGQFSISILCTASFLFWHQEIGHKPLLSEPIFHSFPILWNAKSIGNTEIHEPEQASNGVHCNYLFQYIHITYTSILIAQHGEGVAKRTVHKPDDYSLQIPFRRSGQRFSHKYQFPSLHWLVNVSITKFFQLLALNKTEKIIINSRKKNAHFSHRSLSGFHRQIRTDRVLYPNV